MGTFVFVVVILLLCHTGNTWSVQPEETYLATGHDIQKLSDRIQSLERTITSLDFSGNTVASKVGKQARNITAEIIKRMDWVEHVVINIQKLKGIPGETGAVGMRGICSTNCNDAAIAQSLQRNKDFLYMKEEVAVVREWVDRLAAFMFKTILVIGVVVIICFYKICC